MTNADLFEVTSTEIVLASRRLTSATNVQTALGIGSTDTTLIESIIDRVSALVVQYCNLAKDVSGKAPTFAQETCRATWYIGSRSGADLVLPWRAPMSSITSVVEDDVTLTAADDYQLTAGGLLRRLSDDASICWSTGKIVVVYVAGWTSLPTNVPPDLEARVIDQVKMEYQARKRDPSLRSEAVPDVYQASFLIAGGDSIGESGLLVSLEGALGPYRSIPVP